MKAKESNWAQIKKQEFSHCYVYLLGMPETNFKGRSTLNDLSVRKSILSSFSFPCKFINTLRNNIYETTTVQTTLVVTFYSKEKNKNTFKNMLKLHRTTAKLL